MPTTTTTTITCIIISPMNPKTSVINAFNDNQANPTWCVLMKWIEGELICTRWPISLANYAVEFPSIVGERAWANTPFCLLPQHSVCACDYHVDAMTSRQTEKNKEEQNYGFYIVDVMLLWTSREVSFTEDIHEHLNCSPRLTSLYTTSLLTHPPHSRPMCVCKQHIPCDLSSPNHIPRLLLIFTHSRVAFHLKQIPPVSLLLVSNISGSFSLSSRHPWHVDSKLHCPIYDHNRTWISNYVNSLVRSNPLSGMKPEHQISPPSCF